jgi:hypothetical protein
MEQIGKEGKPGKRKVVGVGDCRLYNAMSKAPEKPAEEKEKKEPEPIKCGIVMPLSECDGCPPSHWSEVQNIIRESLEGTPFKAEMVSEDSVSNILQARIVGNLYKNEMVICDVSGRNPNVMLELGLRLAFDKPVIVIKDDATPYSFDTSPIEHLGYPRTLRYADIGKFKEKLKEKVLETYEASKKADYRSFLSHFQQYTPKAGTLPESEIPVLQILQKELSAIREEISKGKQRPFTYVRPAASVRLADTTIREQEFVGMVISLGGELQVVRGPSGLGNAFLVTKLPDNVIKGLKKDFPEIEMVREYTPPPSDT